MKQLHDKVNIVPVIGKADTLTPAELNSMKQRVLDEIEEQGITIYELPDCESDEDEEYVEQTKQLKASMPFAVVGSNTLIEVCGKKVRGRLYPWGVVEVENPKHCDFVKLRTMLVTHMQDLKEVTQESHYENFRAAQLSGETELSNGNVEDAPRNGKRARNITSAMMEKDRALMEKEEELRRMQEMIAKMQQQMKSQS